MRLKRLSCLLISAFALFLSSRTVKGAGTTRLPSDILRIIFEYFEWEEILPRTSINANFQLLALCDSGMILAPTLELQHAGILPIFHSFDDGDVINGVRPIVLPGPERKVQFASLASRRRLLFEEKGEAEEKRGPLTGADDHVTIDIEQPHNHHHHPANTPIGSVIDRHDRLYDLKQSAVQQQPIIGVPVEKPVTHASKVSTQLTRDSKSRKLVLRHHFHPDDAHLQIPAYKRMTRAFSATILLFIVSILTALLYVDLPTASAADHRNLLLVSIISGVLAGFGCLASILSDCFPDTSSFLDENIQEDRRQLLPNAYAGMDVLDIVSRRAAFEAHQVDVAPVEAPYDAMLDNRRALLFTSSDQRTVAVIQRAANEQVSITVCNRPLDFEEFEERH